MRLGIDLRLVGTARLTWRRLAALCREVSRDPRSNLSRHLAGDRADWDLPTQLAAATEHGIRVLAWQKSKDAASQNPKHYPEPIRPPGAEPLAEDGNENRQVQKFGADAPLLSIDDINARLGW